MKVNRSFVGWVKLPLTLAVTIAAFSAQAINSSGDSEVNDATLIWDNVTGASHYLLEEQDSNGNWKGVTSAPIPKDQLSHKIKGHAAGTFQFRVSGCVEEKNVTIHCGDNIAEYKTASISFGINLPPAEIKFANAPLALSQHNYSEDTTSTEAQALSGSFRVDESGSAIYSIPINTPKGIGGISPQLSLSYNSSAGNGPMGMGWNLSGLSSISRCRQTTEQDGESKALTLTSTDRFCLDGQKLLVTSGSYGSSESQYRTELDNLKLITAKGGTSGNPSYFEVKHIDGSTHVYGKEQGSKLNSGDKHLIWNLNQITDNMGNIITFNYTSLASGTNEVVISKIEYNGHKINFKYNQETPLVRPDKRSGYLHGLAVSQSARLDAIDVTYYEGQVHSYLLKYASEPVNNVTQLQQVKLCSGSTCVKPIDFKWQTLSDDSQYTFSASVEDDKVFAGVVPADIDANGISDLLYLVTNDNQSFTLKAKYNWGASYSAPVNLYSFNSSESVQIKPLDIDGDGQVELLFNESKQLKYFDFNSSLLSTVSRPENGCPSCEGDVINIEQRVFDLGMSTDEAGKVDDLYFADANGDALQDWFYFNKYKNKREYRLNQGVNTSGVVTFASAKSIELTVPQINYTLPEGTEATGAYTMQGQELGKAIPKIADFNGDGKADLLVGHSTKFASEKAIFCISFSQNGQPKCYPITLEETNVLVYVENEGNYEFFGIAANSGKKFVFPGTHPGEGWLKNKVVMGDINGDGYTDIFYSAFVNEYGDKRQGWKVSYGSGVGFSNASTLFDVDSSVSVYQTPSLQDMNGDGKADILLFDKTEGDWLVSYQTDNGFAAQKVLFNLPPAYDKEKDSSFVAEWEGDGSIDFSWVDSATENEKNKIRIYTDKQNDRRPANMLESITSGFGNKTVIHYERLNNTARYVRGMGAESLEIGSCQYDSREGKDCSPVYDLVSPAYIVTKVESDAPYFTDAGVYVDNSKLAVEYRYQGLRAQAGGRGVLGFEKVHTYDPEREISTDTVYHQAFPYTGMPKATLSYFGNYQVNALALDGLSHIDESKRIKYARNEYRLNRLKGNKIYQPYLYQSVENKYVIKDSDKSSEKVGSVTTTNTYSIKSDNHANLTHVNVVTKDTNGTVISQVNTHNDGFADDVSKWWLNRVSSTNVTHSRPGNDNITRSVDFEYYADSHGMLKKEIVEPDGAVDEQLTTLHCYDAAGNTTEQIQYSNNVNVSDCGASAPSAASFANDNTMVYRRTVTDYTDSRYANKAGNHLFDNLTTVITRNNMGLATKVRDIDGVETQTAYDAFGKQFMSASSLGQTTRVTRRVKEQASAIGAPTVEAHIRSAYVYVEKQEAAGKPTQFAYFDKMGRQLAVVKQHFKSGWVYQYNRYDKWGRNIFQSLPTLVYDDLRGTATTYDHFDRVQSSTTADNTTTTVTYNKLLVTTQVENRAGDNAIDQTQVEEKNLLGETVKMTDAMNGELAYAYNATGSLRLVVNKTGGTEQQIITSFDKLGRKTKTNDPDKKVWSYKYNALGELIAQTDAKLQVTSTYRDIIGRTLKRDVTKGSTTFDSTLYQYTAHRLTAECFNTDGDNECTDETLSKSYSYDGFGRQDTLTTVVDSVIYTEQTKYDEYGRIFQQFDATGEFFGIQNNYNSRGYLESQEEARYGNSSNSDLKLVYMQIEEMDAFGNVKTSKQNDGKITNSREYDNNTGLVTNIQAYPTGQSSVLLQDKSYTFDALGNLLTRSYNENTSDKIGTVKSTQKTERFRYDNLNRLTHINDEQQVAYHGNGNIDWKMINGQRRYYCYASGRPHALSGLGSTSNCAANDFSYDANGNMLQGQTADGTNRKIDYSHFNKPVSITANGTTTFAYDSMRKRFKRVTTENTDSGSVTTTTYYIGNVEVIRKSGSNVIETRRYLPGAIRTQRDNGAESLRFLHKDHLGSLDSITNEKGLLVEKVKYDAWGKKTSIPSEKWAVHKDYVATSLSSILGITTRGFTGHETVDHADIVHMNGRIYDPSLGRFLQADPHIQAPMNSQSYNRYSYVLNNPLSYTDPSGYFFKKLMKLTGTTAILKAIASIPVLNSIVSVALNFIPGCQVWCSALYNAASTYAVTGDLGAAFKTGAISLASGYALQGIGGDAFWGEAGSIQNIAANALVGGITAELQGGKFGHGFFAAGVTSAFKPLVNDIGGDNSANAAIARGDVAALELYKVHRVVSAALIGGTASVISGGKFVNGAVTGAFTQLFNAEYRTKTLANAVRLQKENIRNQYRIFNQKGGIVHGEGGRFAGRSIGGYVYYDSDELNVNYRVTPWGARGVDVSGPGFSGVAKAPEDVAGWFLVNHKGTLNVDWVLEYASENFAGANVYIMDSSTGTFTNYIYQPPYVEGSGASYGSYKADNCSIGKLC